MVMGAALYFQYYFNYFMWVYAGAGFSANLQDIIEELDELQSN